MNAFEQERVTDNSSGRTLRRRTLLRFLGAGAGLAGLNGLLAACGGYAAPATSPPGQTTGATAVAQPKMGGQLIIGLVAEPAALDGAQVTDVNSARVIRRVTEQLVGFADEKAELVPGLAESWDVSPDGLAYTFRLRKGVKFHDGTPFNAAAVQYSIMRQIDKAHPANSLGNYPYASFYFGTVDKVEVVDEQTVRIVQKTARASFLAAMASAASGIVSPAAVQKFGKDYAQNPVGTGPFKFKSWEKGVAVNLEAFPEYWGGAPKLGQVIFKPFTEDQARLTALQTGGVNFIVDLPPDNIQQLEQDAKITVLKQTGIHFWYVGLNITKPPLDKVQVRHALAYALDKEAITRDVLKGTGTVAANPLNPGTWGYTDDVPKYARDLNKAKQLLAEAGVPSGFEINMWVPESGSGMQSPVAMATVIQANWAEIGVKAKIQTFEWATFLNNLRTRDQEIFVNSWMAGLPDPDMTLYPFLHSSQWAPNGPNRFLYKDPQVDKLLEDARTTTDQGQRATMYQQVQRIALAALPFIPVEHQIQTAAMAKNVNGFKLHPNFDLRITDVWIS